MSKPIINGNTIKIPVKYLLKKYKKMSGYKKAKEIYGVGNLTEHDMFESDAYICDIIHEIVCSHEDCGSGGYQFPNPVDVHAALRQVAPFMFKADHAVEPFIFGWLKRPYAEALDDAGTNTENRIRILKLILLVNPNAVLNINITPLD
jgi:hypothetical protein